MVQFEYPRVIHPLVSLSFGDSKTPTRADGNVLYSVLQEISRQMGSADTFPYPKSIRGIQGSATKILLRLRELAHRMESIVRL